MIINLLDEYKPWLEMAISARDKLNQGKDGGIEFEAFVVAKTNRDGKEIMIVPMWFDDLTLREYMSNCWSNLLVFSEQFTMDFISMRLKDGIGFIHQPKNPDSIESPFVVAPTDVIQQIMAFMGILKQDKEKPKS